MFNLHGRLSAVPDLYILRLAGLRPRLGGPVGALASGVESKKTNWRRLLWYLVPWALATFTGIQSGLLGTLFLLALGGAITIAVRREIVGLIVRIEHVPLFKPAWEIHRTIPGPLRKLLGFVAPFILSILTVQITELGGFQAMLLSLAVSTPVAFFFFRKPIA